MDTTDHAGAWVAGYADYLRDVVGAANATRVRHLSVVRRFIAACLGQGGPGWTGLSVQRARTDERASTLPIRGWSGSGHDHDHGA